MASLTPEEMARQAKQHLQSLKSAGIDWLPKKPLPAAATPSLFDEPPAAVPELMAASVTPEQRRHELTVLAQRVSGCTRCPELASTRRQTVFGVGPINAELCFIGEAPGADEDVQGEPFVGLAGQLLNRIIAACGLKREEVYICNILRCRPPGNRTPLAPEAANCREYLEKTLELVAPKFICCLGASAAHNLLETTTPIGKLRGTFRDYRGIPVACTYHPSYILRTLEPKQTEVKRQVWDDMKKLLARMGKPVPGPKGG